MNKRGFLSAACLRVSAISDHQQSWGYEDGPWNGPGPPLLVAADFFISIHKPPASIRYAPMKYALAVTVEPLNSHPAKAGELRN